MYKSKNEINSLKKVASVDYDSCIECQSCIGNCPVEAIFMTDKGHAKVSYKDCINCGACIDSCPVNAISSITIELK